MRSRTLCESWNWPACLWGQEGLTASRVQIYVKAKTSPHVLQVETFALELATHFVTRYVSISTPQRKAA